MTTLGASLAERIAALITEGAPFVHATVVRAQPPTLARPGDEALVLGDGTIEGFVGGQCAEESVRAAALDVLADGEPLLLRILPDGDPGYPPAFGSKSVVNPCLSGGALEMFLEPRLPPRRVVVVASCGHEEPEALRAALDAGAGFVGLVTSGLRGELVVDAMDLTSEERSRVRTPVGLAIGARTASEVAVSIAAELVRAVRTEGLRGPAGDVLAAAPVQTVDPVCTMSVVVGPHTTYLLVEGVDVWFCSTGCRDSYAA